MTIKQVIAPASEPVTLAELKEELRLLTSAHDDLLTRHLTAAREQVESFTRRALITSTWEATWGRWPSSWPRACRDASQFAGRVLTLPRANLQAVTWVKYLDEDGTLTEFASTDYSVDTDSVPGRIVLKPSNSWPTLGDYPNAVRIRFTAGYGDTAATVPQSLRLAIRFLVAHWFANPAPINIGNITTPLPIHLQSLMYSERVEGFGYPDEEAAA